MFFTAIRFLAFTRTGRVIGLAVALLMAFGAWTAYQRHDAASAALERRAAEDAKRAAETNRRIDNAPVISGPDDARDFLRSRGGR